MTLAELREYHRRWHAGFIWDCPHCTELWKKLLMEEKENKTNEQ